ncbi:MAG: DUF1592 domain-containing protein [Planctomycetota bacterium]
MSQLKPYFPCLALTLLVAIGGEPCRAQDASAVAKVIVPFVEKHCVSCHSEKKPKGDVSLYVFKDEASILKARKTWFRVLEQLHSGEMPPQGRPKPAFDDAERFAKAVKGLFERHDRNAKRDPGVVTMRRLNKAEYVNTVRDLVGYNIALGDDFPADQVSHGFDNVGDALAMSPVQMERYIAAAAMVMKNAIVVGRPGTPHTQSFLAQSMKPAIPADKAYPGPVRPLFSKTPLTARFSLHNGGECKIIMRMKPIVAGDERPKYAILLDGREIKKGELTEKIEKKDAVAGVEIEGLHLSAGQHEIGISFLNEFAAIDDAAKKRGILFERVEVIGPIIPQSHRQLLEAPDDLRGDDKSRYVLERFASRAYRRPATQAEANRLLAIVKQTEQETQYKLTNASMAQLRSEKTPEDVIAQLRNVQRPNFVDEDVFLEMLRGRLKPESFATHRDAILKSAEQTKAPWEYGISLAMRAVLASPKFLFRVEIDSQPNEKNPHPIDDYQLASRLSYFLWSTMPDQELFDLASKKQMHQNLPAQVKRMLADPRSKALVENFARQWLNLRGLTNFAPDPKLFPEFNRDLSADMMTETELFIHAVVSENRNIFELIDGKFTFLNERLAKHYGIRDTLGNSSADKKIKASENDIRGAEFVRVNLDKTNRGGLLTQASILTITSHPTRTSPVKRGHWVLEKILGTPPPPPPPNVPELDGQKGAKPATLRQQLEQHRANPNCAGCHARMDPIGFAFEHFDALGKFREKDGDLPIDSAGELPGGQKFQGAEELKMILKSKQEFFNRNLAEKMLMYSLGRALDSYDLPAVDGILAECQKNDNRFHSLILAIVQSDPFRLRRGKDQP